MAASGLSWFETREDALLTMTIGALPRVRQPELPPAAVQPQPLIRIFADPALDHRGDRLHRSLNVDLAGGAAHRLHSPDSSARKRWPGRRMMRTPWIGHSICRNSRASVGLALVLRPKKVTSTPLVNHWSTWMATC